MSGQSLGTFISESIGKIVLGVVVSLIILSIIGGDVSTGFTILLFSVICTAGISLILWLPIWYGLGYLTMVIISLILRPFGVNLEVAPKTGQQAEATSTEATPSGPSMSRQEAALVTYIRKAKARGWEDEDISAQLSRTGWSADSIAAAFRLAETA